MTDRSTLGFAEVRRVHEVTGRERYYLRSGTTGKWHTSDLTTLAPVELWDDLDRLADEAQ